MKKAVLLLAAVSAFAQANQTDVEKKDVSGFYLGGGIGVTTVYDDSVWPYAVNLDSNDSTYKLFGGYQFNRIVAIEAQYTRYGDIFDKFEDAPRTMVKPENIALMANLATPLTVAGVRLRRLALVVPNLILALRQKQKRHSVQVLVANTHLKRSRI